MLNWFKLKTERDLQRVRTESYIDTAIITLSKIRQLPPSFIALWGLMFIISLCALKSADPKMSAVNNNLIAMPFMIAIFVFVTTLHPVYLKRYAYKIYAFSLMLLILTSIMGHISLGAKRWLNLGIIQFQPSEFTKIGLILVMAHHFSRSSMKDISSIAKIFKPMFLGLIPCIVTITQPDLGTGMVMLMLFVAILFVSGVRMWKFILSGVIVLGSLPVIWSKLHDYQKQRIMTFINPESDILGSGYNITQAKITIGAGGFWGSGMGLGSQTQSKFVPENSTDFIFTVIGEEMGFIGAIMILLLYSGIFFYGYRATIATKDFFLKIVAYSSTFLIFLHMAINIGMNIGIFPVVGIPLPFFSYGRSAMLVNVLLLGMISNAYVNRNVNIR